MGQENTESTLYQYDTNLNLVEPTLPKIKKFWVLNPGPGGENQTVYNRKTVFDCGRIAYFDKLN